jgi:hypothetical protein
VEDQITIGLFDESDLVHLELSLIDEWNEVTCSRWLCSSEKIKVDMLALSTQWRLKEMASVCK